MLTNQDYRAALLANYRRMRRLGDPAGMRTYYCAKWQTKPLPEDRATKLLRYARGQYTIYRADTTARTAWSLAWWAARRYV